MSAAVDQRRSVTRPPLARRGLTLMELMLVLAILVIVGAIVAVTFTAALTDQQLKKAGDQVRTQMGKARVRAMKSGRTHALWVEPNTSAYRIEPWVTGNESTEANPGSMQMSGSGMAMVDSDLFITDAVLPEGVTFYYAETLQDNRAQMAQNSGGSITGTASSLPPILFYPDGTSSTARLTLTNTSGLFVLVNLRGLTGTAAASDTLTQQELAFQ